MAPRFAVALFAFLVLAGSMLVPSDLPAQRDSSTDISGLWEATTPGGSFKILSLSDPAASDGYIFLMARPGEEEREFGFTYGEHLATLTYASDQCWDASERFRLPLWAGGGFYMGDTSYCLESGDNLSFHTDDDAAVYTDYPLQRLADGIDAAGLWRSTNVELEFEILLYPLPDGGWEAILTTFDDEEFGDLDFRPGEVFYRGDDDPDSDGAGAQAWVWGKDSGEDSSWLPLMAFLDDRDSLRFEIEKGPETGTIPIKFTRLY